MIYSTLQYLKALSDPAGRFRTLGCPRLADGYRYRTGNDAVVFRIIADNRPMMLKCYLRTPQYMAERCMCSQITPLTAFCRWLDDEMLIDDESGGTLRVPVTVGEWIEGKSLDESIYDAIARGDSAELLRLSVRFDDMALQLLGQEWAHGDLKPENIIVGADGMRLIDIDSAFAPSLAGSTTAQLGTAGFRHPSRDSEYFDRTLDYYPIALISTTLRALAYDRDLYRRYNMRDGVLIDPNEAVKGRSAAAAEAERIFARRGDAAHIMILRMLDSPVPFLDGLEDALLQSLGYVRGTASQLAFAGGRWGYTDDSGRWVIGAAYDNAFDFTDDCAAVSLAGVLQYIDRRGRPLSILPDEVEAVKPARNGRARIRIAGRWEERELPAAREAADMIK